MSRQAATLTVHATRVGGDDWYIEIPGWGSARCDARVVGTILDDAADDLFGPADDPSPE